MKKNNEFDTEETTKINTPEEENNNKDTPSVNSKEKALALIRKELAKKGVWHTENEVGDVLDALYEVYEADGTVPTREAFAERCANKEVTQTVLGMGRDPFLKKKLGKRGVTAICAGCVLAIALIGGGVWWAVTAQPQDSHDAGSSVTSVSERKDAEQGEEASEETKVDGEASEEQQEADEGDADADEGTESTSNETAQTTGSGSAASGSSTGSASSGGTSGSASSGSASVSTGGSSSSGSSQSQHVHNWVAQTTTVHHDAVYKTVHHDAVTEERHICNGCGSDITGSEASHAKSALLAGNSACSAWHSEWKTVQAAYDEQVLVSNAWDETVTTGYRCSTCGATK